ncbi:MAG TPA: hypothetical protein VKD88_09170 [Gaiellaceae bacterium]|nr:hypothetical protein [Gaiellaceae bacterium]
MTETADLVHFEIADLAAAVRLTRRLATSWTVSLNERRDVNLVTAQLRKRSGDLAVLLRDVEAWVEEERLYAIRYELDGREYVIQAGEPDWRSCPRASWAAT